MTETIAAIATPPGLGGIGIVRVSGPLASRVAAHMLGCVPKPRQAVFSPFHSSDREILDQGIALFFPEPHSFTGEDVLELHGHGSPVILDALLQSMVQYGVRLARPGEFSERAFLNQKIDLLQAEAIADLIHASSMQSARAALSSLRGVFSAHIHILTEQLKNLRTLIEACIDFPEEVAEPPQHMLVNTLNEALRSITQIQQKAQHGLSLKEGHTVAIMGPPNVGKSSLLNWLIGEPQAIVSPIPGTTRDVIRAHIHLDGIPIHLMDTAGLRDTEDAIEQEGVNRAHHAMRTADVVLWISDASSASDACAIPDHIPIIRLINKIDLLDERALSDLNHAAMDSAHGSVLLISVKEQMGLDALKETLKTQCLPSTEGDGVFVARRRHVLALNHIAQDLHKALQHIQWLEIAAEDLRSAQQHLDTLTGVSTSDDLLKSIFSNFCLGK